MNEHIAYVDLKTNARRAVRKLRYLHNMMDLCETNEDYEPCTEMAQSYIKQTADTLEIEIGSTSESEED